jgi:hypothetical protein
VIGKVSWVEPAPLSDRKVAKYCLYLYITLYPFKEYYQSEPPLLSVN